MSTTPDEPTIRLLRSDLAELSRSRSVLASGRAFVEILCPPWLSDTAFGALQDLVEPPGSAMRYLLDDPWAVPAFLKERSGRETAWLDLPWDDAQARDGVLGALNLHREKFQVKGVRIALLIPGGGALEHLLRIAPDLHSYRDLLVTVRGEKLSGILVGGEAPILEQARRSVEDARKANNAGRLAHALGDLADTLVIQGRPGGAEDALAEARTKWSGLALHHPRRSWLDIVLSLTEWRVSGWLGRVGRAELLRHRKAVLASGDSSLIARLFNVADRTRTLPTDIEVLRFDRRQLGADIDPDDRLCIWSAIGNGWARRGWHAREKALRAEADTFLVGLHNRGSRSLSWASTFRSTGEFSKAHACAESAREAYSQAGEAYGQRTTSLFKAGLRAQEAEWDTASHALEAAETRKPSDDDLTPSRCEIAAEIASSTGRYDESRAHFTSAITSATNTNLPTAFYQSWSALTNFEISALQAGLPTSPRDHLAALARAQEIALAMAGDDPPWYKIRFLQLRGRFLLEAIEAPAEAIPLLGDAWSLRRDPNEDLAPESGRLLALAHARNGRPKRALEIITEAEHLAEARLLLAVRIDILAAAIEILRALGAPADALREVFEKGRGLARESGSRRIEAGFLLVAARALPPSATDPDPLDLLREARATFLDMPYPDQAGRCMEASLRVLDARGEDDARILSQARRALSLYRKHGMVLREATLRHLLQTLGRAHLLPDLTLP